MTDELELLLEEQEQEEELSGSRILTEKRKYPSVKKTVEMPGEEIREQRSAETVQEEERFSETETGKAENAGEVGELLRRRVLWMPAAEREQVRQGREASGSVRAARAVYEQLSRTKQAAGYRRPVSGAGVQLMKPAADAAQSAQASVREIDRLFQRDARRYDGGFVWQ